MQPLGQVFSRPPVGICLGSRYQTGRSEKQSDCIPTAISVNSYVVVRVSICICRSRPGRCALLRKFPIWIVLASYILANTVASSWHHQGHCFGHSDEANITTLPIAQRPKVIDSGPHHGQPVIRATSMSHHTCHNHALRTDSPAKQPTSKPVGHQPAGEGQHDPCHCVVCDFLAIAPLAACPVTLVTSGEVLPEFVVHDVLPVSGTTIETHLARGPPAA